MSNDIQNHIHPGQKLLRYSFFVVGIIATIAYRVTPFLNPLAVKIAWYVGTIGFVLYFAHRAQVETKRANLVKDYNLVDVVEKSDMVGEEKQAVFYLVKTSLTSKTRYNSIFILAASLLALIASIALDLHFHF